MQKKVMIIGGSPCSGKSTAAERLAAEFGACRYQADDHLEELIRMAADRGKPACRSVLSMSSDEIWMRDPEIQCREEFQIYREIAPDVFRGVDAIEAELIVAEGAAFTPEVVKAYGAGRYLAIIPTPEFQTARYRERQWVSRILADCSDKAAAFHNWMRRDILFAVQVEAECAAMGIPCIVNDGSMSVDRLYQRVKQLLDLSQKTGQEQEEKNPSACCQRGKEQI